MYAHNSRCNLVADNLQMEANIAFVSLAPTALPQPHARTFQINRYPNPLAYYHKPKRHTITSYNDLCTKVQVYTEIAFHSCRCGENIRERERERERDLYHTNYFINYLLISQKK